MNNKCTPIKKNDTNDFYIFEIIVRAIDKLILSFSIFNHEILSYYTYIDDKVFIEFKN